MEKDVRDAIFNNDVGKLVEMMERYHFLKDGTPISMTTIDILR